MTANQFEITTSEGPTGCVLEVRGDLDALTAPELTHAAITAIQRRGGALVVDLANVPFIDSSGMSALVRANLTAKALGTRFGIRGATGNARRALDICGLTGVLEH